ncbi:hypothetical protein PVAND_003363 [Polypedilum vanderplanki]|uniref:Polyhomeotic-proximal chromatin protein-like n=1 Tax=Polypedilum vanderplanki TaxID=319348 RepID=A0A9J6BTT7_POLVA|nr:hypothetical protein PVAND_003363 [Polypedilum vanderplanki]
MERPRGFFTKRTEHYNNIQKEENKKKAIEQSLTIHNKELDKTAQSQSAPSPKVENLDPNKALGKTPSSKERPLKCLETLAQKAGITFDEKYENSLSMEKSQSPAQQQVQAQQMPLQLTPDQFSQLQQQFQIQQYATGTPTIQVKQEYATQQQPQSISAADLKTLQDQHNQLQQMQIVQDSPQSPHQNQAAQNALQQAVQAGQLPAEYLQQRVQVLQQPIQNSYLQQMYSPQLVMSAGNFGLGQQQQIQLIAGKPFQNQLTPQMLNAASGKPVLATGAQGFSYTLPTSQSQTLLFSPVAVNGVISSQTQAQQANQQNMLPTVQTQNTPTKSDGNQKGIGGQKVLQKVTQSTAGQQQTATVASSTQQANQQQQCVQISQTMPTAQILGGQTMQLTPWQLQGMTTAPFWATTNGIQPQTLVAANPIFIRGTNPDGSGTQMLFQQSPTPTATQTVQSPHNQISLVGNIAQATAQQNTAQQKVRPNSDALTPKTPNQQRAPTILPQGPPIRPASSVSTQTNQLNQNATLLAKTPKVRTKQTPVRPAAPNIKVSINQQTGQPTMMQQVVTPAGVNKMVLMSNVNGQLTPVLQQSTQQILTNDKLKAQQQAQQQVIIQQMATQQAIQQQAIQQQIAQLQQQQLLQNAQAQNAQLMATQQGGIQQVVLQQQPQMPTVTVTSSANLGQQTLPTHLTQQGIMTKAGTQQIFQMTQPASSQSASIATSIANANQIITSMAGGVSSDTSNAIIGPLSSPQTPLQPPQNPLIAMSTLSASPMAVSVQKEKVDAASGVDSNKVSNSTASTSITSSPLKRPLEQENDSKNDAKKQTTDSSTDMKKEDGKNLTSSPNVKNNQQTPSTPNSTTKAQNTAANNSPLTTQNGEVDAKKATTNGTSTSAPLLKNELPKAMVKPNVLTHVIEGYVIQESNEPFPVTRQRYSEKENDEPPKKKQAIEETKTDKVNGESSSSVSSSTPIQSPSDMVACEQCGKQEMRSKLKRKKFCSANCARASKNSSIEGSPAVANNGDDRSVAASPSITEKSKAEANESSSEIPPIEEHVMMKWSVTQVCDFIKNLPGCSDYAEDFAVQEIDGQALLLLKENHLVSAMGMKLGPALKIVNKIESMRVSQDDQASEDSMEQQSSTGQ